MSERFKIIFAYTAICTIWGSTWLAIKIGLETITPLLAASFRFITAAIVLFGIIRMKGIPIPKDKKSILFFTVVSLTSFSIPFGLVYWGEQYVSSGLTSILFAVFPFCVAIMSTIFLPNEKMTSPKIFGIVLGFTGIVIIFYNDAQIGTETISIFGMAAIVISAVMQSFAAVTIKKYGHDISPFVVSFLPMLIAGILLLLGSLLFEDFASTTFTSTGVFSIIYLAVFGSVTTFVSYFWLLKRVEVVFLSLTSFITPIIAIILGVIMLNENISSQLFIGSAFVLVGILSANITEVRKFLVKKIYFNPD